MFGEEEIFNPQPRSFYAISRHPNTFLYVLKKKVITSPLLHNDFGLDLFQCI